MKVAWFTPFAKQSSIGYYSKCAAEDLSKDAEVDLFISEQTDLHKTQLPIINFDQSNVLSMLESYDICVYNMGDNPIFHASVFDVMRLKKGIVISHDYVMHNFFRNYYLSMNDNGSVYKNALEKLYGRKDTIEIIKAGEQLRN